MKPITTLVAALTILVVISCGSRNQTFSSAAQPAKEALQNKNQYVTFTKTLYDELLSNHIDIKRLQFYLDQKLVLIKSTDKKTVDVVNGGIVYTTGQRLKEIIFPVYAAGNCMAEESDGLKINFEKDGKVQPLKFLNSKTYSPENYIFTGSNWDDKGTCEIEYENEKFRASCGTCASAADIKLLVKVTEVTDLQKDTRTVGVGKP